MSFFLCAGYIFVIGGSGDYSTSYYNKTEVVSISEVETEIPECMANLADHPNEIYSGAGGALPDSGEKITTEE